MIIGGISGALSRTLTAPLELNKIQKQNSFMKNNNLSYVIKNEGITKLWKGNMANVIRIFPQMGINYSICQSIKRNIFHKSKINKDFINFVSAGISGSISIICIYPLENIRTRLSLQTNNKHYNGILDTFRKTKIRNLYGGLKMSLIGFTPYNAFNFMFYNIYRKELYKYNINEHLGHLLAGGLAGSSAVTITYPTDLMRRRLQIQGMDKNIPKYNGISDLVKKIIKYEGFLGFYRGLFPCYLKIFPSIAIQFYTIEVLRNNIK